MDSLLNEVSFAIDITQQIDAIVSKFDELDKSTTDEVVELVKHLKESLNAIDKKFYYR